MKPIIISLAVVIACSVFLLGSAFFPPNQSQAIADITNNAKLTSDSVKEKSTLIADASKLKPRGNMDIDLSKAETTSTGLMYIETQSGDGETPVQGKKVTVHYTGYLTEDGVTRGKKFDSSLDRNKPFVFTIGVGQVIKGWDEGVAKMKVGSKSTLIIPPNATLIFDVELLGIK